MNTLRLVMLAAVCALLGACASLTPQYPVSTANVDTARALPGALKVGKLDFAPGRESELNSVRARASIYRSPVNDSFPDYIAKALETDLAAGGRLNASSPRVVTGVLEKNDLSAAAITTNSAEVAVRFKVTDGARTRFDKVVSVTHEWDSSFLGAIAIPRAIENYVVTVQKLVGKLLGDSEFKAATAP